MMFTGAIFRKTTRNRAGRESLFAAFSILPAILFLLLGSFVQSAAADAVDLDKVREAIKKNGASWTAAENPLMYKSLAELKGLLTAEIPTVEPGDAFFIPRQSADPPAALDWRDNDGNFITPIRNQWTCGSCWAFAAIASTEANFAVANDITDPTMNLSEQHILSCSGAGSCDGGSPNAALIYIKDFGAPDEDCFPYGNNELPCGERCSNWESRATFINDWAYVTTTNYNDIDLIKAALMDGPVTTFFKVYLDFIVYRTGVYEHVYGPFLDSHIVLIVGWDDSDQSWIVKNSWGLLWGSQGYFKIKWGEVEIGSWTVAVQGYECSDGCLIDGFCRPDGIINYENPCEICNIASSTTQWTALDDGDACDDGLFCNGDDFCNAGHCSEHQYPDENGGCDDGLFCNGDETCNEESNSCDPGVNPCLDDGFFCNGDESCDEQNDTCAHSGNPCDPETETCDEDTDLCDLIGDDDDTGDDDTGDDDTGDDDTGDDDTGDDDTGDDDTGDDDLAGSDDDDDNGNCCGR